MKGSRPSVTIRNTRISRRALALLQEQRVRQIEEEAIEKLVANVPELQEFRSVGEVRGSAFSEAMGGG